MKNLILLNRSGMSPEVTCRKGRHAIESIVSRFSLVSLICVLMLTLGVGNAWGANAPVNTVLWGENFAHFGTKTPSNAGTGSGTTIYDGASISYAQSSNNTKGYNEKLAGGTAPELLLYKSNTTWTISGIKTGGATGMSLTFLSNKTTFSVTVSGTTNLEVTGSGKSWTISLKSGQTDPGTFNLVIKNTGSSNARIDNVELKVTTAGGGSSTPSVTPDPTSLSWGTVLQGSSQSTKTISITGANLTAGTLTISATGGYSVTPTSKSVSGTLSATILTVTPPSTATTGAKNGKVTISGGGLASNVEVNLSMTVNAASTVTWMVNGSEYTTTLVANGQKPTFPANPSSCDATSTTFYGWSTTAWSGKTNDISGKTIYTSAAAMPAVSGAVTYHAVFCQGGAGSEVLNEEFDNTSSSDASTAITTSTFSNFSGTTSKAYKSKYGGIKFGTGSALGYITSKSLDLSQAFTVSIDACKYGSDGGNIEVTVGSTTKTISNSELGDAGTFNTYELSFDAATSTSTVKIGTSSLRAYIDNVVITTGGAASNFLTTCCSDPGLAYGTASVTKTFGDAAFTNTLTNSHSVAVTYSSSDPTVATVNASTGEVTIQKAGSTTITASSAAQTVAAISYCADEVYYDLTVNKANISPSLSYDPAAVTVGNTLTSFTLSGNTGNGTVTYSSSDNDIATVNSSTGVVTGVASGTVTITATIAATTNYNENTAVSNTITVNAAACTGTFSLHTGTKNGGDWVYNQCFSDADWGEDDDAIYVGAFPTTNECYVGYAGSTSYHGTYWGVGGIKTYDIPTGRTLGWNGSNYYQDYPGGALGTFHIYKNSTDENYYLRFKPSSYILRTGSDGTSWTSREMTVSATNSHYYETAELDLNSTLISEHAYVDLKTNGGDGHVWCNFSNDRTASGNVKVKSSVGDADGNFRGDNLKASDNGTHGKFRIDVTKDVDNWKLAFVPMYRITYAAGTGASGSMDPSSYAEISTTIAAAANGFTAPTGKQFNGWSDGVNSYAAGANVTMNSNVTLTAQWTDIDYTVTVSQSPDVSATTTGQTSTAHYNGTINLTTTIPDGYRFVNWTTSDGFSITNSTSATTASFTMPAKNVTVTANFQQTHTVDWYVGGSAPANKIGNDGQTTVVDHGGKISDFPATTPDGSACEKTFVGWTNTSSYVHGTSPLFNDVAGSPTINADASFYAVFAEVNSVSASLTKMTADDDLEVGDKIVIIAQDTRYGMYQASASSYVSYWTTTDMDGEPSLSEIEADDKKYLDVAAGSASNTWKLGDATNGYLYNASSTNLEFSTTNSSDLTLITWTDDSFTLQAGQYISCRTDITGANANKWRGAGASCDPENDNNCSGTEYYYLYKYVPGGTTYTGHTINCADCGSSVTPTYTASPTGGTVSVTKSATPVASGSTVKTCTAVDLTVTLTPATHYTLTGFTATGLTTGAATISPAVNTVVPTTSAQTFTVTVSAGATGTLNLTPTFTPETPLTITLSTNSKGTFTNPDPWPIYSGESFTFPDVTPNDPSCATFVGWIEGTTFVGDGTTHDAPVTIAAGSSSGAQSSNTTYTAVFYETETSESDAYVKVTAAPEPPATWANDHYLIVDEVAGVAFDGSRTDGDGDKIDAASNTVAVSITSSAIAATNALAASEWKIALISGSNYSIQSASGKYIGNASNSNALSTSSSALANTLSISSGDFEVVSDGGAYLRYNATSGQERFRYYKSSSYSSQQAIQLYKLGTAVVETRTYTTNPSCTPKYRVTVASVTGGSPSATPKFNPEDTEVTLTANPAAGYSFTSWAMENSSTHADATSLLSSSTATTATFSMPAYDVTVTASYAKKMVSTLEVKDGETVVSTTTGPVSGTVNVSTGANKTLDVVITPSDAFDHSWTASVTAGGTYASITNVTDDGFRVNGLAQGDATITVNAPNDGSAKSVTLTVHVTDIMPEEIILKREGSDTPIETLVMYYDANESKGQYVKVNVGYSPANPTNKAFTFSSALSGKVGSHSHAPASGYEVLVANGVTTDPVNCTFTSSADGSVTKVLAVTVLPILTDRFVDYVHGNATQTVSARLSADRYTMITDINTPSLSDASDADPTSEDCETAHYHLIGWLPQATAEALMAAGTSITDATEGLVRAGAEVEATGQTWCAIWAEEQ